MTPEDLAAIRARDAATFGQVSIVHDDRRALLAEVDRLNYHLASPFTTWRGVCGHLWDRAVDDTDVCPRCALLAEVDRLMALVAHYGEGSPSLPIAAARDAERARIRAAVEGLPDVCSCACGYGVDRAAVLAAIDGEAT